MTNPLNITLSGGVMRPNMIESFGIFDASARIRYEYTAACRIDNRITPDFTVNFSKAEIIRISTSRNPELEMEKVLKQKGVK